MDINQIADFIRTTAEKEILPRFKRLNAEDISQKSSATDLVTIADLKAEERLSKYLSELYPEALIGGEESIAENPALKNEILNADLGFLIDPIDGTNNFIKGNHRFAVMLVALQKGETVASWIYLPLENKMAMAEKASGCFIDNVKVIYPASPSNISNMIGASHTKRMKGNLGRITDQNLSKIKENRPAYCAGYDYISLLEGRKHFSSYGNTLPWDHLPGTFMIKESGGTVKQLNGEEYTALNEGNGILSAENTDIWQEIHKALFTE